MAMTGTQNCPFGRPAEAALQNGLALAVYDKPPVMPGHMRPIPRRHVANWFETAPEERRDLVGLADEARAWLILKHSPDGSNLGVNVGEAAGKTAFHVHLHLIPRHKGEVPNPRGGVRGVIPARRASASRQNY